MRRAPLLAVGVAAALTLTAACGIGDDTVLLRMGHVNAADDPWQVSSEEFAAEVAERSNGQIEVQVFPGSQLGGDRDMVEGMQIGSVDLSLVAGVLSSVEPSMALLEVPYLFDSIDSLEQALDGPGGQRLSDSLLERDIRNLAWLNRGPRELTLDREIRTPEELAGAKIRTPEIPASLEAWRAFGANPTPLSFNEVYGGLQQGVIDGQENPLAIIESGNLAEVQGYVMETDHVYGYVMLAMSDRAWRELTPEQQQILTDAAAVVRDNHNARVLQDEETYRELLEAAGMTFVEVDQEAFREASLPVQQRFADEYGQDLYDELVAFND